MNAKVKNMKEKKMTKTNFAFVYAQCECALTCRSSFGVKVPVGGKTKQVKVGINSLYLTDRTNRAAELVSIKDPFT